MDAAVLAGMTEDEFWDSTPAEIERRMWAHRLREKEASRDLIRLAWWTVKLERARHVPALHTLLYPARTPTEEERRIRQEEFETLSREMGG